MPMPPPYGTGQVEHPQGTTVLVLGILSIVVCGPLGLFAWVKGNNALAETDRNPMAYSNRSYIQIGRILGIVGSCLAIFQVAMVAIWLVAVAAASSGTS
jgi:hypothetical protein